MTIEADLFTALKSLVGNRVALDEFPQPPAVPTWPAIRYQIDSVPVVDACGDGDDDTAEVHVALEVVANTAKARIALRLQVMAAMRIFSPPATLEHSQNYYEPDTKTYRVIMDYRIEGSSTDFIGSP